MTVQARLYGGSLYDLAAEEQLTETFRGQMEQIRLIFLENPDYVRLLKEPSIPCGERESLVEEAFGGQAEPYLVNFLKLLCRRGLLGEYYGCCEEFRRRYNRDHGILEAVATTASGLSPDQAEVLKKKLEKLTGKQICLIEKKNAAVLGGLQVELEGKRLDGTIKGRLRELSRRIREAPEELTE